MAYTNAKSIGNLEEYDSSGDEYYSDDYNHRTAQETKGWNVFQEIPIKQESGSMETKQWIEISVKFLKLMAYIITFVLVLGSAVISKGTLLFMTAQIKKNRNITHCNTMLGRDQQYITRLPFEERIAWMWCILFVFALPELFTFFRSLRICFFKNASKPKTAEFLLVLLLESLHTVGVAMLLLLILPDLDAVKGAMLTNCVCLVPALLNLIFRSTDDSKYTLKLVFDILSLSAQVSGFLVWPIIDGSAAIWLIPLSCSFISLTWWENYVDCKSRNFLVRVLARLKDNVKDHRYQTYKWVAPLKIAIFFVCILISLAANGDDPWSFVSLVQNAFDNREYNVTEVHLIVQDVYASVTELVETDTSITLPISWTTPLWVALIQATAAYICFISAKYACKILIQGFSFALALSLVVPVTINILIIMCGLRNANPCAFTNTIPDYLFFEIPPVYFLGEYLTKEMAWMWLLWLLSQMWISIHIWFPRCERLAATEKLFALPHYSGALVDQSMVMNRSKDEEIEVKFEDLRDIEGKDQKEKMYEYDEFNEFDAPPPNDIKPSDHVTRIYICATMWHETKDEMIEFLKSIFRLDADQCALRIAQKYLHVVRSDYYEIETHIFMDDAFEVSDHSIEDSQVNRFVKQLVNTIDEAASEVHCANVRLRSPKKYPTPYGGRLEWTMPGKNKLICHLKDKSKIRHRKRWSQVMYMYYFLGHRLMELPISVDRKDVISSNTFLLALDGDIDFQPKAVTLLVDLMKKNKNLGAACGRIHPIGSGPMVWYQMFEYAIGHWLQKATEHMIGCVLCSPGCFSLFRGKALMEDNVMRKYTTMSTEARHHVQYDQGEDRWLCTLLLQQGYRVEYSAASDAYTHCPEGFNEFFNQRRRWVPSTMANILDLLTDAKRTINVNNNISRLYIAYQMMLMIGTVLGPGTIFLMLVGALVAAFGLSNWQALQINIVPVIIFLIVCMTCKSDTQLFFAGLITCFYGLLMMAVLLGIALQVAEDGWLAPSSIFTIITFSVFLITAALHPQEVNCLMYILVYYITIPSMYMLLIIYSVCNMNNVTWGTREVAQKKTAKEMEHDKLLAEEAKKTQQKKGFLSSLAGKATNETSGTLEMGVSGLFKCICCTNPNDHKEDMHLVMISSQLERIENKMKNFQQMALNNETVEPALNRRNTLNMREDITQKLPEYRESEDSIEIPREERDDLSNPYWIEDPNLQKGEVDFLTLAENQFWKDLIDTYLRPIDVNKEEQDRVAKDLKDLRDKMVFAFTMLNALFILVIFLLQLNQDQLHIPWPFGQKLNLTYLEEVNVVYIEREYLRLEPIGSLFIIFFGLVMIIQFTAMLFHRFGTLTHLMSTVQLNWYCTKDPSEQSLDSLLESQAVDIVKTLQQPNLAAETETPIEKRKTIHNLEKARQSKPNIVNLGATFKKRLDEIVTEGRGSVVVNRRKTSLNPVMMKAVANRRVSVVAAEQKRKSQAALSGAGAVGSYVTPRMTVNQLGRPSGRPSVRFGGGGGRSSVGVYDGRSSLYGQHNLGFAPASDSESGDEVGPLPSAPQGRKSQVNFKDYNC